MDFQYQAANAQGHVLNGQISALDEREAMRLLQQQNLTPIAIISTIAVPTAGQAGSKKASSQDKTLAIQELTTLLNAGVPLAESVDSISSAHAGTAIGSAFAKTLAALRSGERFSEALRKAELDFPTYLYQLAAAGELTGKLGHSLHTAVTQMEYENRMRQEMRNALTYPAILVVSGIAATLLVFIVVVPKFSNLLKGNTSQIPLLSQWVIGTGMFVQANLLWVGMGALAILMGVTATLRNPIMRARAYEGMVRLPLLGQWIIETEMGRWASMLSALLENRVPIITAMDLALTGVKVTGLRNSLQQVLREVRGGARFADALAANRALEATGINLVRVGERSGELAPMLRALSTLYENAGRDRMKRFLLLLEPIAILLIGSVIGVIMVAIMLAVTSMNDSVA
ncbi:MAG: type II secretion system F family protein [Comamonadaceae bacterium CG_4_9_14_0_8_um_filter_57_21]|nr:MAG: type II secretion system F family protein [Comamonadaceae bacterium CG_4_9_14_0_8_um_filter_57_21]